MTDDPANASRRVLPRTVIVLGFVSLLNDLASEMVIPLIPILLATVLGAGPIALGLIEGVADAVASFLKLWAGRLSDRLGGRRKTLTLIGYTLSNVTRPLLAFAGSWFAVMALRSLDRIGKGVRSAPRDALVADSTPAHMTGYAYGFHRALDNAGAVLGSLVAAGVLFFFVQAPSEVILWSAIPGALAVLLFAAGVKEAPRRMPIASVATPPLRWRVLSPVLRRYLLVLVLFTLGRASETFIVLRGYELGQSVVEVLLLWAALSLAKAATSTWGGRHSDTLGRVNVLILSWGSFGVSFLLFMLVTDAAALWPVAIIYGAFAGFGEGAERARISDFATASERGTAFGWYYLMVGLASIPAGLVFGAVWHFLGAQFAFGYAASAVLLSALLLRLWVSKAES